MWNNLYGFNALQIARAYETSTIMPFVYTHNQSSWPTLQEMIDSGKRLVNFIDTKADPVQVPWLMDQFSNVFETPYDNTDIDSFNCNVDRIAPDYNPNDLMYVVNHFIYGVINIGKVKIEIPLRARAQVANAKTSLNQHVQNCTTVFQKRPNFIEVDFYSVGDALGIVANLNGVPSLATNKVSSLTVQDNINTIQSFAQTKKELVSIIAEHVVIDNVSSSTNSVHNYYFSKVSIVMFAVLFVSFI
ncbi:MAG: PLC-like phosphodiesterase [Benjaminiella poitrasii]|nr:MAG: PLC-like phosphodiesterase [Benjaminiella poitrasii]